MASYIQKFSGVENREISTTGLGVNSTTTDTILQSFNLGSSAFTTGDNIILFSILERGGTNGNIFGRFYINTGNTLTGAIQVGARTLSITQSISLFERRLFIANDTGGGSGNSIGTQVISSTLNVADDFRVGNIYSSLAIDWTQDIWLMVSGNITTVGDAITCYGLKAFKY